MVEDTGNDKGSPNASVGIQASPIRGTVQVARALSLSSKNWAFWTWWVKKRKRGKRDGRKALGIMRHGQRYRAVRWDRKPVGDCYRRCGHPKLDVVANVVKMSKTVERGTIPWAQHYVPWFANPLWRLRYKIDIYRAIVRSGVIFIWTCY